MKTNTLQIRHFPYDVNRALKKKALDAGLSFRELIVRILTEASEKGE